MADQPESGTRAPDGLRDADSNESPLSDSSHPAHPEPPADPPAEQPNSSEVISADEGSPSDVEASPASFAALPIKPALLEAIAKQGWTKPTEVQAKAFGPISAGQDVLVESHTGSGKTGAFCLPWLASRFDPIDPRESGVQLLVLTPTRELAKQVCDELDRLAVESPVRALAIYGGTAMRPQFDELREGLHAVVGTPGRLLDHVRRRSLDLSRVRLVVLDEADEMLSMGFLEDIRAILDACAEDRQTALFSATIPTEIERISKRYMRSPVPIRLSGDQVSAAEIRHVYYSVAGSLKTRDLLDVIEVEEPTTAIVFCNTREETNFVASSLQREGLAAEQISSDLTQTARERVMKRMREGKIRFLVATDVAARGIDVSHVSHVINYTFPEYAESYVHRTGRTGRAGRPGTAVSLISPKELGNFYELKLQYPSITFTESSLPPPEVLASQRVESRLDRVSHQFTDLVTPDWTLLARNLAADPRGERIFALLLQRALTRQDRPSAREDDRGDTYEAEDRLPPRRSRGRRRGAYDDVDSQGPLDRSTLPGTTLRQANPVPAEKIISPVSVPAAASPPVAIASTSESPVSVPTPRETSAAATTTTTDGESEGDSEGTGRKRRRRRRRRRGAGKLRSADGESGEAQGDDASDSSGPAVTATSISADVEANESADSVRSADEPGDTGDAKRGRRRRRRRRGGAASSGNDSPPDQPRQQQPQQQQQEQQQQQFQLAGQDEIVLDLDEDELNIVRDEFGEIDELDEFTLKARRRAVIDVLRDEVELEDLSARDQDATEEPADEADTADEVAASESAEDLDGSATTADDDSADEDDANGADGTRKRRRRRRRRKKKVEPETPELMVAPHKDFWEAWSARFTYQEFEDDSYYARVGQPEEVDAASAEDESTPAPVAALAPRPARRAVAPKVAPSGELVRVRLNIGRAHGKKAAHVRAVLEDKLGLTGRDVRDLTVRENSSVFRVDREQTAPMQDALHGVELDGVLLEVMVLDTEAEDSDAEVLVNPATILAGVAAVGTDGTPSNVARTVDTKDGTEAHSGEPEEAASSATGEAAGEADARPS